MAQATGSDSTKTNTSHTRRIELLRKVLDGPLIQTLVPAKPAVIEMGTLGKSRYKTAALKWLKQKYKEEPRLFPHWHLVHP